ncbi:hypothetical protein WMY93_011297 [Mugilogobius chulae]|uniref:Uncharacterized protein n=1 Tax=Mugilogobius chulae TaxID=88201 RepID=A0AAW0P5G2_9GOBI
MRSDETSTERRHEKDETSTEEGHEEVRDEQEEHEEVRGERRHESTRLSTVSETETVSLRNEHRRRHEVCTRVRARPATPAYAALHPRTPALRPPAYARPARVRQPCAPRTPATSQTLCLPLLANACLLFVEIEDMSSYILRVSGLRSRSSPERVTVTELTCRRTFLYFIR